MLGVRTIKAIFDQPTVKHLLTYGPLVLETGICYAPGTAGASIILDTLEDTEPT